MVWAFRRSNAAPSGHSLVVLAALVPRGAADYTLLSQMQKARLISVKLILKAGYAQALKSLKRIYVYAIDGDGYIVRNQMTKLPSLRC